MDVRKLQRTILDALEDVKARDIKIFNTTALSDVFDRVVVATGTSGAGDACSRSGQSRRR